jgi:TolB-like protein/Tfp pilus assembly protein PilF
MCRRPKTTTDNMPEGADSGVTPPAAPAEAAANPVLGRDVFITYASPDLAVAQAVCNALESARLTCWMAPRDVMPGDFYGNAIVHAIDSSKVSVLVLSANATASPHVLIEVERATSKRHPVIALRLDEAERPAAFEYFLNASQWLDATHQNLNEVLPRLVESISLQANTPGAHAEAFAGHGPSSPLPHVLPPPARSKWKWAAAVVMAFVLGFVGYRALVSRPAPPPPKAAAPVFSPPPHSIAVLPLVNMSGDASQDYFSDGISEELLDSLSRLSDLQVAAATSSFSFKGKELDVPTIARKLNVGAILEGSFRRVGNKVRISVQLINAITGFQMWSQSYDRDLVDILKLQSEVAVSVTQQLKIKLVSAVERIELGGTDNPAAYDAYLHGMQLFYRPNARESSLSQALAAFDEAIALDPKYAAAYVRKVAVLISTPNDLEGPNSRSNLAMRARQAAERAVAIAPQYGEAHLALAGTYAFGSMEFIKATHEYRLAAALAPGSAYVQRAFGSWASLMGYYDAAIAAGNRTVALDPQNYNTYLKLGGILKNARHYEEALAAFHAGEALVPNARGVKSSISEILLATGQYKQARELCESSAFPLDSDKRSYCLTLAYHGLGMNAEAKREFEKFKDELEDLQSYYLAYVYAQLGDTKAALQWLATAELQRDPRLAELKQTWDFDPIRKEPAFRALVDRLKFPGPNDLTDPSTTVVWNR